MKGSNTENTEERVLAFGDRVHSVYGMYIFLNKLTFTLKKRKYKKESLIDSSKLLSTVVRMSLHNTVRRIHLG